MIVDELTTEDVVAPDICPLWTQLVVGETTRVSDLEARVLKREDRNLTRKLSEA